MIEMNKFQQTQNHPVLESGNLLFQHKNKQMINLTPICIDGWNKLFVFEKQCPVRSN